MNYHSSGVPFVCQKRKLYFWPTHELGTPAGTFLHLGGGGKPKIIFVFPAAFRTSAVSVAELLQHLVPATSTVGGVCAVFRDKVQARQPPDFREVLIWHRQMKLNDYT